MVCVAATPASVAAQDWGWGSVGTPWPGAPQVIGTYTAGCMIGAVALPQEGPGHEAVRVSRNRHWGHPTAIALTLDLADRYRHRGMPHIYVGDISQPRGGPAYPQHASHQLGLD